MLSWCGRSPSGLLHTEESLNHTRTALIVDERSMWLDPQRLAGAIAIPAETTQLPLTVRRSSDDGNHPTLFHMEGICLDKKHKK